MNRPTEQQQSHPEPGTLDAIERAIARCKAAGQHYRVWKLEKRRQALLTAKQETPPHER